MVICIYVKTGTYNTLRPRRNGQHFTDDIFKRILFNENIWIWIKISQKFVPKGPINNIPALVQIMAWRRPGDKPLSEPVMVSLPTHLCVTRPRWVESIEREIWDKIPSYMYLVIFFPGTMRLYCKRSNIVPVAPNNIPSHMLTIVVIL